MTGRSEDLLTGLFRFPLDPGYADAARRRAEQGAPAPAWRTGAARAGLAVILVLTGFLLAVAYRQVIRAEPATGQARSGLLADIRARRSQTDDLQRRADHLRDAVTRERQAALDQAGGSTDLRQLTAVTGLGAVTGDGVTVRVADAPAPVDPVTGRQVADNPGVVVDRDVQDIANALWESGAEAVAVNGQRLTATTTIRTAGGAILVDFRPVTSPYDVSAIGPASMAAAFTDSATAKRFRRYVTSYRMGFSVRAQQHLELAAATEPRLQFVSPSPSPSPSPAQPGSGGGPAGSRQATGSPGRAPAQPPSPAGQVPSGSGGGG